MRAILSALCLLPLWANAQSVPNALLWRISPADGSAASYLFGTVHSRDVKAYSAINLAHSAMEATLTVYGEVDMAAAQQAKSAMAAQAMMPGGTTLEDLFSKGRYKRVEKALRAKLGPMFLMVTHMKPILLSAMLTEDELSTDSSHVLDEYLQIRARGLGKRTGGIETMVEQLAAMDAVPLKDQAEALYQTVRTNGHPDEMDRLLNAYAAQDLGTIAELMKEGGMSDAFARPLLTERNGVMAHRIDSLMNEGPALFAIGAAHLPGTDGVIALLRQKGARLEPVTGPEMIGPPVEMEQPPPPLEIGPVEKPAGTEPVHLAPPE